MQTSSSVVSKVLFFALLNIFFMQTNCFAGNGDTTKVQTLSFSKPARSGVFQFPTDTSKTYEKIIMLYSMRCKNGLVSTSQQRNLGCGEWDYNCYTYLVDSAQTDSIKQSRGNYDISHFSGTTFPYATNAPYNYIQYNQQQVSYLSILSETTAVAGTGTNALSHPFSSSGVSRTQYLWKPSEIGLSAGNITGMGIDISALGSTIENLRIRIKASSLNNLDANNPDLNGFTEVYFLNTLFSNTGAQRFNFHTPFVWDGTSALLVDISYTDASNNPIANEVLGGTTGFSSGISSHTPDNYLETDGGISLIHVPTSAGAQISKEVTIAFWCYGNPSRLPDNTIMLEAKDASDILQMNLHLPWSDSNIYWDCGNDGTGIDRINKAAQPNEIEGQWNFWTFTKNATSGEMKIFLNGKQWLAATGKNKPITPFQKMNIGHALNGDLGYYGYLDEFSLWNAALDSADINSIMNASITPSHPQYAQLQLYYKMDENNGSVLTDASIHNNSGNLYGMVRRNRRGKDLSRNFTALAERPNMTFISGTYTSSVQNIPVLDSASIVPRSVLAYTVVKNNLTIVDTSLYWAAGGYTHTTDEAGNLLDSALIMPDGTLQISKLNYYDKHPSRIELINFITPYGIGLDLDGVNGKTWSFDVTDYTPVLKGKKFLSMEGGNYQEDNDITFVFYEGTPARKVKSVQQIWPNGSWFEVNSSQILNNDYFEPRNVQLSTLATQFKLRSAISGHGQQGEFISRNHTLRLNNNINYTRAVWKECAQNPIYPQGGTWVYDRAGWCPGAVVDMLDFEITDQVYPGQFINLEYSIPQASNYGDSRYRVNNQLVSYGDANFSLDAAVDYIKTPSKQVEYARLNPICHEPIVAIKNTGSTTLTSVDIVYGRKGGTLSTFNWSGSLGFLESTEVTLPQPDWLSSTSNEFVVTVKNPNGGSDQYAYNDLMTTSIDYPVVYPTDIYFELRTNNNGSHTAYTVKDSQGNDLIYRDNLSANTLYKDTLNLPTDCYTVELTDMGNDGLSWWANPSQGTGFFRVRSAKNGAILKTFNPDFGDHIYQQFTVNYSLPVPEIKGEILSELQVYPDPANDFIRCEFSMPLHSKASIRIMNMLGQTLMTEQVIVSQSIEKVFMDVSHLQNGMYYAVLSNGEQKVIRKWVVAH